MFINRWQKENKKEAWRIVPIIEKCRYISTEVQVRSPQTQKHEPVLRLYLVSTTTALSIGLLYAHIAHTCTKDPQKI